MDADSRLRDRYAGSDYCVLVPWPAGNSCRQRKSPKVPAPGALGPQPQACRARHSRRIGRIRAHRDLPASALAIARSTLRSRPVRRSETTASFVALRETPFGKAPVLFIFRIALFTMFQFRRASDGVDGQS